MTDLSIVIVNWNTREHLSRCLQQIYETVAGIAFEVIVVDNASRDGSPAMVKNRFPQVKLLENEENVGFARANNQAIRESAGRYVLLLNPDAFVIEGTIDRMVEFMDAHTDVGMAGCQLLGEEGTVQPSCTGFPTLATEFFLFTHLDRLLKRSPTFARYRMTYWDCGDVRAVDVIQGAFMLVRQEALDEVGLLDEGFFMYSEEMDWCYRFKEKGWPVYYVPYVQAVHIGGQSTQQVRADMILELYRSRVMFFRKHYGQLRASLLKLLLLGASVGRVIFFSMASLLKPEARPAVREQRFGYWKLLRAIGSL
jgi:hypothetical protein